MLISLVSAPLCDICNVVMWATSVMVLEPAYTTVLFVAHAQICSNSLVTLNPKRKVTSRFKNARSTTTGSRSPAL